MQQLSGSFEQIFFKKKNKTITKNKQNIGTKKNYVKNKSYHDFAKAFQLVFQKLEKKLSRKTRKRKETLKKKIKNKWKKKQGKAKKTI